MHLITETLLVGNIIDANDPPLQIGALLLLADEYMLEPPDGLPFGRIPFLEFGEAKPLLLDRAVSWIERHMSERRVMVCCRAGMGRSVSVAMSYLCCVEGMTYAEVLKLVLKRRPGAMPLPKLEEAITQVRLLREARVTDKKSGASHPATVV